MSENLRPPYTEFFFNEEEDREKTIELGYYIPKKTPYVRLMQIGSRDTVVKKAEDWLSELRANGENGRVPLTWHEHFNIKFKNWLDGNEAPEFGTPVLGNVIYSPEQQQRLIRAGVRTLEDAKIMNDETIKRLGMDGRDLKNRAVKAMESANSLATKCEALEAESEMLKNQVIELQGKVKELETALKTKKQS